MCRLLAAVAVIFALLASPSQAQFPDTAGVPKPPAGAPPGSQMLVPAPGPAIGGGQAGSPTYVVPLPPAPPSSGGVVSLGPITGNAQIDQLAQDIANSLVLTAMGWIFWLLKNKLNVNIDKDQRDALTAAAQRQASSLVADGMVSLSGKSITVNDKALFQAVNALQKAAPDAIAHFGITDPQHLADRIVDMIPHVPAVAPAIAEAHAAPANGAALPPQLQLEKPS